MDLDGGAARPRSSVSCASASTARGRAVRRDQGPPGEHRRRWAPTACSPRATTIAVTPSVAWTLRGRARPADRLRAVPGRGRQLVRRRVGHDHRRPARHDATTRSPRSACSTRARRAGRRPAKLSSVNAAPLRCRRTRRCAGRRDRGDRQPDRHRLDAERLRDPRPDRRLDPDDLDDQRAEGRHAGQRRRRPARSYGRLEVVFVGGTGTTQLVLDVTGYFIAGDDGARYHAVQPARVLDTRAAGGVTAGAPLRNGVPQAIVVGGRTDRRRVTIPADAVAVTGNLTVTGQTRQGYLSLTPTPQASPSTSTLNFPVGDTRANNVTVPLGAGGRVWVVLSRHRHGARHPRRDRLLPRRCRRRCAGCRSPRRASSTAASASGNGGAFRDDLARVRDGPRPRWDRRRRGRPDRQPDGHSARPVAGYASLTPAPTRHPRRRPSTSRPARPARTASPRRSIPRRARSAWSTRPRTGATTHLLLDVTGYYH